MSLTRDQYDCCLNSNSLPKCAALGNDQPNQITTPACKNAMVRHCQVSSNITTPMCRTFINNLVRNQPPLADMDRQVTAFCAMNREEKNKFYKECECVNVANTCLGQKILRYKAGNPGCYYPPCKNPSLDSFMTSSMYAQSCTSITCAIGDITIKGGEGAKIVAPPGMINQNCGNLSPQPPRAPDKFQYVDASSSMCTGTALKGDNATSSVPKNSAGTVCKGLCDARDDCNAYQTHCSATKDTCDCSLFATSGVGTPLIPECAPDKTGSLSQDEYEKRCTGSNATAKDVNLWFCGHHRDPPAKVKAPAPAPK